MASDDAEVKNNPLAVFCVSVIVIGFVLVILAEPLQLTGLVSQAIAAVGLE